MREVKSAMTNTTTERLNMKRLFDRLVMRIKHAWYGCAKFNRLYPHWIRAVGQFPKCSICNGNGYWIYGYKHFLPDIEAQKVQQKEPDENSTYWAKHDGYA